MFADMDRSTTSNSSQANLINENLALWDPSLVATLSFDPNRWQRYLSEKILLQTRKKWHWFVECQTRDPSLGTLSYLPFEIRRLIWQNVLACRDTLSSDGIWEFDFHKSGSPVDPAAFLFGFGRRGLPGVEAKNLRMVSSSMTAEYDNAILSTRSFRFNHPQALPIFFNRLNENQLSQIQSIEIGLLWNIGKWTDGLSHLPASLQRVTFLIHPPLKEKWFSSNAGQAVLDDLEPLAMTAIGSAPDAQFFVRSMTLQPLPLECQKVADRVLMNLQQHRVSSMQHKQTHDSAPH